jgi:hypothetical protein
MNGKYLERFGKTWGTKAKHATAHGAGVRRSVTTISCMKILPSWPNEAKNSCVFRLLTPSSNRRRLTCSTPRSREPAPVLERRHRRHAQHRTATAMPKTALPPCLVETVGIAAADPVYFMRSVGSTVAVFFWRRRRRDQRANGWAPFQSSVPRDFLSALRPARAVPAHRRRGDGADKNEATVRLRYHEDAIHEQADRWSRCCCWSSALEQRPRRGPWCGSTYNCGFYSFEQCYETVRGAGGGPRTSVTAGRQDGA